MNVDLNIKQLNMDGTTGFQVQHFGDILRVKDVPLWYSIFCHISLLNKLTYIFQVILLLPQTRTLYQIWLVHKFPTKLHLHLSPCRDEQRQEAFQRTWQKRLVLVDTTQQTPIFSDGRLPTIQCLEEVSCLEVNSMYRKSFSFYITSDHELQWTLMINVRTLIWCPWQQESAMAGVINLFKPLLLAFAIDSVGVCNKGLSARWYLTAKLEVYCDTMCKVLFSFVIRFYTEAWSWSTQPWKSDSQQKSCSSTIPWNSSQWIYHSTNCWRIWLTLL